MLPLSTTVATGRIWWKRFSQSAPADHVLGFGHPPPHRWTAFYLSYARNSASVHSRMRALPRGTHFSTSFVPWPILPSSKIRWSHAILALLLTSASVDCYSFQLIGTDFVMHLCSVLGNMHTIKFLVMMMMTMMMTVQFVALQNIERQRRWARTRRQLEVIVECRHEVPMSTRRGAVAAVAAVVFIHQRPSLSYVLNIFTSSLSSD